MRLTTVCALLTVADSVTSRLLPPSSYLKGSGCFSYLLQLCICTSLQEQFSKWMLCKYNIISKNLMRMELWNPVIEQLDHRLRRAEQPAGWRHL